MSEQIKITIMDKNGKNTAELCHHKKRTLLHTLREGGLVLPSLCNGLGKCGRCLVRFRGYEPFPSQADRAAIAPDKLRDGYRLACTARPVKDCTVETFFSQERKLEVVTASYVSDVQSSADSREMSGKKHGEESRFFAGKENRLYIGKEGSGSVVKAAAAVDIGTTTIAIQMIETKTGHILDTYTCFNPQRSYGADVISRIQADAGGNGEVLQRLVREALAAGIGQMKERADIRIPYQMEYMVVSANTAMGHLFMGYPAESLGKYPFTPVNIKTASLDFLQVPAVLVPGISAFVGGDIVSGLYACGLCCREMGGTWLFLDLGTNAEMVMGNGNRVVCTAAAAGPAFEGRGRDGATGPERIVAIAALLEKGIADSTGLLAEPYFETGIAVETGEGGTETAGEKVWISQEDIRNIQMAKAAVRAGIHFLMEHLGVKGYEEIGKVYVAGGFGFYLDKRAAARTGLIPFELEERIETVGNTSLAGARLLGKEMLAAYDSKRETADLEVMEKLEKFADRAEVFQLAEEQGFEKIYVDYLNFEK